MSSTTSEREMDQLYVWPWVGIIANIQTQMKGGRRVGESGAKLRDELTRKGFAPLRVNPLWNFHGHSGFAIVEFKKDWDGFKNAIMFEKDFEVNHRGKEDYMQLPQEYKGDKLFGWVARDTDFNNRSIVGDHLRKIGDFKSVSSKEAEDKRKDSKLLTNLTDTLQKKNKYLKEMELKYTETVDSLNKHMIEKEAIVKAYNEEMTKMQQIARDHFEKISLEHEKATAYLEAQRKELEQREKQLQQREFQNVNEKRNLQLEKEMNERAILEQKKADENMLRLAEEQKTQKEKLRKKVLELEKKLDAKQALELEIESMKGAVQIMKHMEDDEDMDAKKKMVEIQQKLMEKEEELDALESLNQTLIYMERMNNDELQEARQELVSGLNEDSRASIGVKKMGELDIRPFRAAAKTKFLDEEADLKAMELCSLWDDYLRDPSWHPFKVITDKAGNCKGIINANDEKLQYLKNELGAEVYDAVVQALTEINEYNPSGRYIVREIWNFKEKRKASLKEGVQHLLKQWKLIKRRKTSEIEMPLSATILDLKREIEAQFHIEVAKQTLTYDDDVLEDYNTIESYNFEELTNLELSVTPDAPLNPKFTILVWSSLKEMEVNVRETYTVKRLKEKLERRWGIVRGYFSLIHENIEMEDGHTLSDYNIDEGSEIELVVADIEGR